MDNLFSFGTLPPMVKGFLLSWLSFFCAWALPAQAEPHTHVVQTFETYFNTLKTFSANFTQHDPAQNLEQKGTFTLKRPKQFNWTYTSPLPQRIISTGSRLFYIDDTSEQVTQLPLNIGLAAILTQDTLDLDGQGITVVTSMEDSHSYQITLQPEQGEDSISGVQQDSTLTLVLNKQPLALRQMVSTNALGQRTFIAFTNPIQNTAVDDSLFHFEPPQEANQFLN